MGVWIFNGISTYIGIFSLGFNSKETIIYKAMLSFNKVCLFNSTDCMEVAFISALAHQFLYYISLLSIVNKNREKVSSNKSLNTMKGVSLSVEPILTVPLLIPKNTSSIS